MQKYCGSHVGSYVIYSNRNKEKSLAIHKYLKKKPECLQDCFPLMQRVPGLTTARTNVLFPACQVSDNLQVQMKKLQRHFPLHQNNEVMKKATACISTDKNVVYQKLKKKSKKTNRPTSQRRKHKLQSQSHKTTKETVMLT